MEDIYTKDNLGKRIGATIVDRILFFMIIAVLFLVFSGLLDQHPVLVIFLLLAVVAFWFFFFPYMEFKFGATLGHQLFNLKVYSLSGRPPSFSQCLKRRIADLADFSFYGIVGIIIITQSSKHQRAGDHWAKTYVVDIKDPMQMEHINNSQGEWVF